MAAAPIIAAAVATGIVDVREAMDGGVGRRGAVWPTGLAALLAIAIAGAARVIASVLPGISAADREGGEIWNNIELGLQYDTRSMLGNAVLTVEQNFGLFYVT